MIREHQGGKLEGTAKGASSSKLRDGKKFGSWSPAELGSGSRRPSVQRYSLGDLTAFVTNQPVEAGSERGRTSSPHQHVPCLSGSRLCISYIEPQAPALCIPQRTCDTLDDTAIKLRSELLSAPKSLRSQC